MAYQILSETVASISELKRDPIGTVAAGEGLPVAILNRNEPAFYCIPAQAFEAMMERLESVDNQVSQMTAAVRATKEAKRSASLS